MTQEIQAVTTDAAKIEPNEPGSAGTADMAQAETSNNQNSTTPGLVEDTSTEFDNSNINKSPSDVGINSIPAQQNFSNMEQSQDNFLIEKDVELEEINKKKYEVFLRSLKRYGGEICNEIIKVINLDKNAVNKKDYQDLYNNPILLFRKTYDSLKNNPINLLDHIKTAYEHVNIIDQGTKQIPLPLQFILGIMLKAYKDTFKTKKDFVESIRNEKSLSLPTCYNYLKLTTIIERIDDNRIFSIGLKNLYKLSSLIRKKAFKNPKIEKEIINMFYNLTNVNQELISRDEQFTDGKFQLAVDYVIFYYKIGMQAQLNKEYFAKLFDAFYKWTDSDVNFINEKSVKKDAKGKFLTIASCKNQYQLSDPTFINIYMKKLIENDFNGKTVRNLIKNPLALPKSQIITEKKANPNSINWLSGHLTETIEIYINEKREISNNEIEMLKELQKQLNILITNNSHQATGETK